MSEPTEKTETLAEKITRLTQHLKEAGELEDLKYQFRDKLSGYIPKDLFPRCIMGTTVWTQMDVTVGPTHIKLSGWITTHVRKFGEQESEIEGLRKKFISGMEKYITTVAKETGITDCKAEPMGDRDGHELSIPFTAENLEKLMDAAKRIHKKSRSFLPANYKGSTAENLIAAGPGGATGIGLHR